MVAILSKVSVKSQTVIPATVRKTLGIRAGDNLRYTITSQGIVIDRAPTMGDGDPFVAFHEWATAEEDEAWKDL
jgi:antitoxin PrlF